MQYTTPTRRRRLGTWVCVAMCSKGAAPVQATQITFRYNRRMQTKSSQRLSGRPAALGLMVALALSSAGCEALGLKKRELPPMPAMPTAEAAAPERHGPRRLRGFSGFAPVAEVEQADPGPVAAATPPAGSGGASTLNGNPNGLSRDTLNVAIQGTMASLATCFSPSAQNPMVAVSFEADPSGRASLVRVNGAPADAERCVRNYVQNMRFPPFEGNGVHVDLPLTFHQVGRSQPGVPSGEAAGPSAPPLFLEP